MSLHQLTDITRQLGSGWKCGAIDHPPGGRCKLWLGPQDIHDPFSELLVITAHSLAGAVAVATRLTHELSPDQAAVLPASVQSFRDEHDGHRVTAIVISFNGA